MNKYEILSLLNRSLLRRGKAELANYLTTSLMEQLKKTHRDPYGFFLNSMSGAAPMLGLKRKKVSGVVYSIPFKLTSRTEITVCLRWLTRIIANAASKNVKYSDSTSAVKLLLTEVVEASSKKGSLCKKQSELYKSVVSNRPNLKFLK